MSRRGFLSSFGMGLGGLALGDMLHAGVGGGVLGGTHFAPRAKRVIYLFQAGGPSQLDLLDYKPLLNERHGEQLPDEVRKGQRLTGMSGNQSSLPLVGSPFKFSQHGEGGLWFSDRLPHTAKLADDLCVVRSLHSEAINHGPGVTFMQTGSQIPGRPSIGGWLDYGLGRENDDLPSFVVMVTKGKGGQPLAGRMWGSGFLPSRHEGVRFRSGKDPVLYLNNPEGVTRGGRRKLLDGLRELHELQVERLGDSVIDERIAQYEMAFRMQASVPEATDLSSEPDSVLDLYGAGARDAGTYAANCLQARRLAERGVRFIQLYHQGWDQHGGLKGGLSKQCQETDQATAGLLTDLKQRGMLEDTLVVWGGEFGRTNYCQGKLSGDNFGRDHHGRSFSMWMAGGGVKGGTAYGVTDELGYNIVEDGVHVHDLHATLLHLLGIDHERLTYKFQGRRYRL
ncbi:MAG: DUF1501 domain-containing protein, partial [Verrucomicrobiales bacterium]|nr:DUF1501 domain-containing protein [Verrucomicrobiales bacterium]